MSAEALSPLAPISSHAAPSPVVLTLGEVVEATGARLIHGTPDLHLGPLDIDSRRLNAGDWFLAHRGATVDGHAFLGSALDAGIAGAVVTDPSALSEGWTLPSLAIDDHAAFLDQLGHLIRSRVTVPVIGITGSVGKTTTRHTLSHLLSQDRTVLATPGNWNTEIGVPLTLSRLLRTGADVLVLEMAMRGTGQIAQLTQIARPTIGILTAIAPVHLEILGSLWAILEAKLELFREMPAGGWWIYPAPDAFIRAGIANLADSAHQTLRFVPGMTMVDPGDPDLLVAERVRWDAVSQAWHFTLHLKEERVETHLNALSLGQLWCALAAASGALAVGLTLTEIAERLPLVPPATGRAELRHRFPKRTILFDAYNSNPLSAADALETLARIAGDQPTIAILAGMKELGPETERYHRELGGQAKALKIDKLLAIGEEASWIATGASGGQTEVFTADSIDDSEGWLQTQIPGEAVVLLKGSRAYALEQALEMAW